MDYRAVKVPFMGDWREGITIHNAKNTTDALSKLCLYLLNKYVRGFSTMAKPQQKKLITKTYTELLTNYNNGWFGIYEVEDLKPVQQELSFKDTHQT